MNGGCAVGSTLGPLPRGREVQVPPPEPLKPFIRFSPLFSSQHEFSVRLLMLIARQKNSLPVARVDKFAVRHSTNLTNGSSF